MKLIHTPVPSLLITAVAILLTAYTPSSPPTLINSDPGEKKGDTSLPSSPEELRELMNLAKGDYKYSVEDFFRNPEKASFQISPNGEYVSYKGPYQNRMNIFIQKIGNEEATRITSETDRDIAGYMWANDQRLIYIKDNGGDENYHAYAVNIDGSNNIDLTPFENIRVQIIDDLEDHPDEIIIGMNKRNKQIFDPYRLNIKNGEMKMLYENPGNITSWMTDHDGKLRIAMTTDGVNNTLMHRASEDNDFEKVRTISFKETLSPLFFTFDNKNVYALSNLKRDKDAVVKIDLQSGEEIGQPIFLHDKVDAGGLSYSRKRKVLTSVSYNIDKRKRKFLDDETDRIYRRLEKELSGKEVVITSSNKAEDKFLVRTYSDRSLGAYYFYDKKTDKIQKISEVSPWLNEADMATMKAVSYQSRDGMTIPAYLTLPKDKENARNLPVVINPHGGPWARDNWGWDSYAQMFASRGYAVLQMNFRGSTGYGRQFWEAGFKKWGQEMQNDITDGAQWLIDQGIADPDRIAIFGGSYGGYATLSGVTFTPDLYAAAIDYVGVSNLFTFMNTIPPYWKPYLDMMYEMVGDPTSTEDSLMLYKASPVFHVDRIQTPLMVIQGANDPRVNVDESDQIVKALRKNNVEVPYIVKYDEGHGFHNEENRIEANKLMLGFLAKHLQPKEAAKKVKG